MKKCVTAVWFLSVTSHAFLMPKINQPNQQPL